MPTACSKRETKRFESKKGKSELSPADDQQARHFNLVTTREFDGGRVAFGLGCTWGNDRPLHPKQDGALQHFNLEILDYPESRGR